MSDYVHICGSINQNAFMLCVIICMYGCIYDCTCLSGSLCVCMWNLEVRAGMYDYSFVCVWVDGCVSVSMVVCVCVTLWESSYRIRNYSSQIITSAGDNVEKLKFLFRADGKARNKRHWKSLKGRAWAKAPGHSNARKLPFCSIIMNRVS